MPKYLITSTTYWPSREGLTIADVLLLRYEGNIAGKKKSLLCQVTDIHGLFLAYSKQLKGSLILVIISSFIALMARTTGRNTHPGSFFIFLGMLFSGLNGLNGVMLTLLPKDYRWQKKIPCNILSKKRRAFLPLGFAPKCRNLKFDIISRD